MKIKRKLFSNDAADGVSCQDFFDKIVGPFICDLGYRTGFDRFLSISEYSCGGITTPLIVRFVVFYWEK